MYPTFNSFSLQDSNFITERIEFKGYGSRAVIRGNINRREGVKLLATEFGEKQVDISGIVVASSSSTLQTLLDSMKMNLTEEEGSLVLEQGRTFRATVIDLDIPDEHYNQSVARFTAKFMCSDPFSTGTLQTVSSNVVSGTFTYSGTVYISGTMFARPTVTFTPAGAATGNTNIKKLVLTHTQTGQILTISGFGSGAGLSYANAVTLDLDAFTALEGSSAVDTAGGFPRWEPGTNNYTVTVSGRFPGGSVGLSYQPRYL